MSSVSCIRSHTLIAGLGRGLVVNMPWWINAFFSGIGPFMDPITRDKIRFNPKLTEMVSPEQLDKEFGGEYNLEFDHAKYWPELTSFCHLAEDGGRVDNEGEKFYPLSGNGITWALEQHEKAKKAGGQAAPAAATPAPADAPAPPAAAPAVPGEEAAAPVPTSTTTAPAPTANGKPEDGTAALADGLEKVAIGEGQEQPPRAPVHEA